MSDSFIVNINCIVFSVDIANNKRYVLSTNDKDIIFPKITLTKNMLGDIDETLVSFLKEHVCVNQLELMPQLITLHNDLIETEDNNMNAVYGFIIEHTISTNNCYWIEFNFVEPTKYSEILFETIQQLK